MSDKTDPLTEATEKNKVLDAIDGKLVADDLAELPRGHLGMSQIGGDKRTVWLQYRWSFPKDFAGRTLRIFEMGHVIEEVVLDYLQKIGVEVHGRQPDQIGYSDFDGHFAGSLDGMGLKIPGAPKTWHVLEVKTSNKSRFAELQKKGYQKWSPAYYAQLQLYMLYSQTTRALVIVYCKDNSELYVERIHFKKLEALGFVTKATEILNDEVLPGSSYPDRTYYEIASYKSDEYQAIYWGDELPQPNCRNCQFSQRAENAEWGCNWHTKYLTVEDQVKGCSNHNYLVALLSQKAELVKEGEYETTWKFGDIEFVNSEDDGILNFLSEEIVHLYKTEFVALGDEKLLAARKELGGRITELENLK